MAERKFTPFRWLFLPSGRQSGVLIATSAAGRARKVVAEIDFSALDEDEAHANATLICNAPDLYEALSDLLFICDQKGGADEPEEVRVARKILAKARGEG